MATTIQGYIDGFPTSTRRLLNQMLKTIKEAAPAATEKMAYGIPTLCLEGNLVHFAGYKNHIGFYPGADGIAFFEEKQPVIKGQKGSVQFPIDQSLPLKLVTEIVQFRVKQNLEKAALKKKAGKSSG
jgi:uncharacterized protein YdhG (YjbR/CyaY superfamily)